MKKRKTPSTICTICGQEVRIRPCGPCWITFEIFPVKHYHEGLPCDGQFQAVEDAKIIVPKR